MTTTCNMLGIRVNFYCLYNMYLLDRNQYCSSCNQTTKNKTIKDLIPAKILYGA